MHKLIPIVLNLISIDELNQVKISRKIIRYQVLFFKKLLWKQGLKSFLMTLNSKHRTEKLRKDTEDTEDAEARKSKQKN